MINSLAVGARYRSGPDAAVALVDAFPLFTAAATSSVLTGLAAVLTLAVAIRNLRSVTSPISAAGSNGSSLPFLSPRLRWVSTP